MSILFAIALSCVFIAFVYTMSKTRTRRNKQRKQGFIRYFQFPSVIKKNMFKQYPHLSENDYTKVIEGLHTYFWICNMANLKFVAMPSKIVDVAWHEFILNTHEYASFCNKAFGKFLHHSPAESLQSPNLNVTGMKRAWYFSCKIEGINTKYPSTLPLLFSIDSLLNISDGFIYSLEQLQDRNDSDYVGLIGCLGVIDPATAALGTFSSCGSYEPVDSCSGSSDGGSSDGGSSGCGGGSCGGGN